MKRSAIHRRCVYLRKRVTFWGVPFVLLWFTGLSPAGVWPAVQQALAPSLRVPVLPVPVQPVSRNALTRGQFLVASRHLRDPNFAQTVVLLIDYNRQGAMGLIINWPTETKVATALPEVKALRQRQDLVYVGGPVARDRMVMLIRSGRQPEHSLAVIDGVYASSSLKILEQMTQASKANDDFRVYAGHAGWAPGQLEVEVDRGDWHILSANAEMIFDTAADKIWPELIRKSSVKWLSF